MVRAVKVRLVAPYLKALRRSTAGPGHGSPSAFSRGRRRLTPSFVPRHALPAAEAACDDGSRNSCDDDQHSAEYYPLRRNAAAWQAAHDGVREEHCDREVRNDAERRSGKRVREADAGQAEPPIEHRCEAKDEPQHQDSAEAVAGDTLVERAQPLGAGVQRALHVVASHRAHQEKDGRCADEGREPPIREGGEPAEQHCAHRDQHGPIIGTRVKRPATTIAMKTSGP